MNTYHLIITIISLAFIAGSTILLMAVTLARKLPYAKALAVWQLLWGLLLAATLLDWPGNLLGSGRMDQQLYYSVLVLAPLILGWLTTRFFNLQSPILPWAATAYGLLSLYYLDLIIFDPLRFFRNDPTLVLARPVWWISVWCLAVVAWAVYLGLKAIRSRRDPFLRQRYRLIGWILLIQTGMALLLPAVSPKPWGWLFILLMLGINILEVTSFIYYPFYKLYLGLQNLLIHSMVLVLLSILPALLFGFILTLLSRHSHAHVLLLFFPLFLFLIPYARITIPWLTKLLHGQNQFWQPPDASLFNEVVKLKYPEKWADYVLQAIKGATHGHGLKLVIKQIEKSQLVVLEDHKNTVMPSSFYSTLDWFVSHPGLLAAHDLEFMDQVKAELSLVKSFFTYLDAMVLMPLVLGDNFLGCIVISGQSHVMPRQGIVFLEKLKPVASIALYNAYFYEQIRQMSRDLWDINEHLHEKIRDKTRALEDALNRMVTLNEEQKSFFTMASHNLKTPLTSIKAASAMLWGQSFDDEFKQGLVKILSENTDRLESLLNNIIIIAQMENKNTPQYSLIDFPALIEQVQHLVNMTFSDKQLEWTFDLCRDMDKVVGYEQYLKLVLEHLMSNACKFSTFGGRIEIKLNWADQTTLAKYNSLNKKKGGFHYYLEFVISDQGEGIPEFEKESIFNSFHQVEKSHKRYQGNGLGLFMVKRIIEFHNGAVTLESELTRGSTFSFIIPMSLTEKVVS